MRRLRKCTFTPVLTTAQYTAADVLFACTEVLGAFGWANGKGWVRAAVVHDNDDEGADITLLFFNQETAIGAANAALSAGLTDAEAQNITSYLNLASYTDLGGCQVASAYDQWLPVENIEEGGETSLWVAGVANGTPTFTTASDLVIDLWIETAD